MQETTKTICFVVAAAVLGAAAVGNSLLNQPSDSAASELLGTPFYPDFVSTESARSLEVSALDPDSGSLKRFVVESDGDLWRIPTHYDYPAEAAARIAETSSSVMGLERQAMVGVGESEFEKFGVIDPLADEIEDPAAAGKRITLKDENNEVLVDYIIGKQVEDDKADTLIGDEFEQRQRKTDFYVRRADDSQTFRVSLDIDLSTRFADWIDPDLLRIGRTDVTYVSINNYQINEAGVDSFGRVRLERKDGDQVSLSRATPAAKWSVGNMDSKKEEVVLDRVNDILDVLDQMKIVGVRPKFKFEGKQLLGADLQLNISPELESDRESLGYAIQALRADLSKTGFNVGGTTEKPELLSENGEIVFGTIKGLRYQLNVGKAVSGDDEAIEIGTKPDTDDSGSGKANDDSDSQSSASDDDPEDDQDALNRYLYLRVSFDESLLDGRPVEPKLPDEPVKPEGYVPAKTEKNEESDSEDKGDNTSDNSDEESNPDDSAKPKSDDRDPSFVAYDEALKKWQDAKDEHEMNLTRFEQDTEAFEKRIEEGKKLVDELNQRFGDWYYVISASNLKVIQSNRSDIVKPVETESKESGSPVATPEKPDISFDLPLGISTFEEPETEPKVKDDKTPEKANPETEQQDPGDKKDSTEESSEQSDEGEQPSKQDDGSDGGDLYSTLPFSIQRYSSDLTVQEFGYRTSGLLGGNWIEDESKNASQSA